MLTLLQQPAQVRPPPLLPEWPDCEYACNESRRIFPDSGNRDRVWPDCPHGSSGCIDCSDVDPSCPVYVSAYDGHGCEDNPAFMLSQCPRSCNACHLLDEAVRCAWALDRPPALLPGSVDATFQRLGRLGLETSVLSADPWVMLVRGAVREDEIEELQRERSWDRASDTGPLGGDGRTMQPRNTTSNVSSRYKCSYLTQARNDGLLVEPQH
mmetsp:Transcript_5815/g.18761  ORF Transcript_5815/g.18761 Transcript_5815/m.18761 type:complete len:211 (-) Transcript_5815:619-1251(-)